MGTDEEGQKKTGKGMSTEMGQRMPEGVRRGGGKADGMGWAGEGREAYEKGVVVMETSTLCPDKKWTPKEIAIMQQKLVRFV